MSLVLVGTNYKYSSVEFRENIFFSKKIREKLYQQIKDIDNLEGIIFLSTCNRIEIYIDAKDEQIGINQILTILKDEFKLPLESLENNFYKYKGKEVLKHLYLVASGLDSLILGETQILGQVKHFFSEAKKKRIVNSSLNNLFHSAITNASFIQKVTDISKGKISVGSVAVGFAENKLDSLVKKNILIIGAGKVTMLILKYLNKKNNKLIFVANRTYKKAKNLARKMQAEAIHFKDLKENIAKADLLISATASPHFILKKEYLLGLAKKPLLILDLAVPRDVEPSIADLENISLFTLENLDLVIQENVTKKQKAANKAKQIINKQVGLRWKKFIKSEPEPVALP